MIQTQEIVDAIRAGKVCLVARYIHNDREHVELMATFDSPADGRAYMAANGETEFATAYSSYRLEGNTYGTGKIGLFLDAKPEQTMLDLIGISRVS